MSNLVNNPNFNKDEFKVVKLLGGNFYGLCEMAGTKWSDPGLFDTPVPSFSIKIFLNTEKDSYIGTLCITPPNGKASSVKRITYSCLNHLTLCHHLIMECYKRCFFPILTNMVGKFERVNQTIHKILNECGNQLLSMYGGISGILSKSDLLKVANSLVNDMRTYDLYVKTIVNDKDNSISNIYAIFFKKYNDTTICKVYHLDVETYKVTLKGGFCYEYTHQHKRQIYKSKLFDNNEFWEMLLNEEFKLTNEYRYFREVIKHIFEFEPSSSGWSSISFNGDVIYTKNNLGHISLFDLSSTCESNMVIDSKVDNKELSTLLASKLDTIKSYQWYSILISSTFLAADVDKIEEERGIIDSIKSDETLYENETIDIDKL